MHFSFVVIFFQERFQARAPTEILNLIETTGSSFYVRSLVELVIFGIAFSPKNYIFNRSFLSKSSVLKVHRRTCPKDRGPPSGANPGARTDSRRPWLLMETSSVLLRIEIVDSDFMMKRKQLDIVNHALFIDLVSYILGRANKYVLLRYGVAFCRIPVFILTQW